MPGTLLWSSIMCETNPAHETRASSSGTSKTEFRCPIPDFLQQQTQFQTVIGDTWGQGLVQLKENEGRTVGHRGEDKKVMWVFLGVVVRNVGFCLCSLSSSETFCLTLPRVLDMPTGRSLSPSSLPEESLPTATPPSLSPKNQRTEEEIRAPNVSEHSISPERLALAACKNSDWSKMPHSLCFFRT